MRDQELIGLYEAYQQVHGLNESTEELEYDTQYSYEDWVNQLVEEGYDLSNWTDEGLYEYYEQLCEQILEIPQSPTPGGITPKKKPSPTPINGTPAIPPLPRKGTPVNTGYKESYDIVFEYLISEGYADTNENALAIMANMSEEWRESIVEETLDERRNVTERPLGIMHRFARGVRTPKGEKTELMGSDREGNPTGKYLRMKHEKKAAQIENDADEQRRRDRGAMGRGTWDKD